VIHAYTEIDFTSLSKECCILSPSLTGIINRLEKQEYVCKIKSAEDQRRVNIRLTEKANTLVEKMKVDIDRQYVKLKQQYGIEKYNQLSALLEELISMREE
jgi:homoprotocatechuate degradation regulator HpaR